MNLKKGQVLYIKAEKYTVINMIEYTEDTWVWQEYEIKEMNSYKHKWLSVEKDENNKNQYYLYDRYVGYVNINEIEFQNENKTYELYEKGIQTVNNFFGNADVDKYEKCEYFDYKAKDGNSIIAIEKWEDEIEKSIGTKIDETDIQITNEIEQTQSSNVKNDIKKTRSSSIMIFGLIFALIFFPTIVSMISGLFVNKSMQKYLKKETTKYKYETSVTNNTNKEKAKVYRSMLGSVDATVKDIINGVPEGITKANGDENKPDEGIGLQTKDEYAFIYKEEQKIYIQVSNKKYLNNSGTMYHSSHYRHYHMYYSGVRASSKYNNYAYSARQKSVNSRTTSGGGTSSGK
mgnify:CR=1 FL=1